MFTRQGWVRVVAVGCAALAAGCASRPPPPAVQPPPPAASCLQLLDEHQVRYDRLQDWRQPNGCGIEDAVKVTQSALAWNRPATMDCRLAETLWRFETTVVQPAAQRTLRRPVRKLVHAGTYDCRGQRGGRAERASEHAHGRAIDLTGFVLDDGTQVSVLRDWRGAGAKSEFLHQVAEGACRVFNGVITPNGNELHRNHLHLDLGPYRFCNY